jgi:hypothetical protein
MEPASLPDQIIVIGDWLDESARSIRLQNFIAGGESFIPVFSDEGSFRRETQGSGLETKGLAIECALLASMLRGDETLILNPGSANPMRLKKSDLATASLPRAG